MYLKQKKIFITGATGGIGSAICNSFIKNDCKLILTSSSDVKLEKLKEDGKYTSSVEREIRTFKSQLEAIDDILREL